VPILYATSRIRRRSYGGDSLRISRHILSSVSSFFHVCARGLQRKEIWYSLSTRSL